MSAPASGEAPSRLSLEQKIIEAVAKVAKRNTAEVRLESMRW